MEKRKDAKPRARVPKEPSRGWGKCPSCAQKSAWGWWKVSDETTEDRQVRCPSWRSGFPSTELRLWRLRPSGPSCPRWRKEWTRWRSPRPPALLGWRLFPVREVKDKWHGYLGKLLQSERTEISTTQERIRKRKPSFPRCKNTKNDSIICRSSDFQRTTFPLRCYFSFDFFHKHFRGH